MDPVSLISIGMELSLQIVKMFRAAGAEQTAAEIEAILHHSDEIASAMMATAQQELDELAAKRHQRRAMEP